MDNIDTASVAENMIVEENAPAEADVTLDTLTGNLEKPVEEKKPEPAKKAKAPAVKPKKEKGANLTDAQVKADYEKAVQPLKEEEAHRADCETKTEHIVLTYNRETESIRVNVKGQRHYLWVDGRNAKKGGAVQMLLELSAACRAMAAMIKGSY